MDPSKNLPIAQCKFRWRLIPVVLLSLYALSFLVGGKFGSMSAVSLLMTGQSTSVQIGSPLGDSLTYAILGRVGGCWMLLAAWRWWKGHWWQSLGLLGLFFALGSLADAMGLFPSD